MADTAVLAGKHPIHRIQTGWRKRADVPADAASRLSTI